MSKLAIFLCAVLFASAIDASYLSDALASAKEKVEEIVTVAINEVKEKVEAATARAVELFAKLQEAAISFLEKIIEDVKTILEKAREEAAELTRKAEDVDVSECEKLLTELEVTGLEVISNMSLCVADKLDIGRKHVQSIITISENVLANLTAIRNEARHCGDNVNGISSAVDAIVCVNVAAVKATWAATKSVPALTINLTKITYLLTTLQPSLAYCTTTHGLATFYHQSSTIVERTKQCIRQKIEEARGVTPEIEYTTDYFYPARS